MAQSTDYSDVRIEPCAFCGETPDIEDHTWNGGDPAVDLLPDEVDTLECGGICVSPIRGCSLMMWNMTNAALVRGGVRRMDSYKQKLPAQHVADLAAFHGVTAEEMAAPECAAGKESGHG